MPDAPRDVRRGAPRRNPSAPTTGGEVLALRRPTAVDEVAPVDPPQTEGAPRAPEAPAARGETWYRDVFDNLPTPTLVTTLAGVVTNANMAACLLLRRPPQGVLGHPVATFVPAAQRAAFASLLDRAQRTVHVADFALSIAPTDAAAVDCRVWVRRLVTFGDPAAMLAWTLASLMPEF